MEAKSGIRPYQVSGGALPRYQTERSGCVDLCFLHGPDGDWPGIKGSIQAWKALESLYRKGAIRALGVSNFSPEQVRQLIAAVDVTPHVVQNKWSLYHRGISPPSDPQGGASNADVFASMGIAMMGYCALDCYPHVLDPLNDTFVKWVGKRRAKTPAQVLLRHALQHGTAVIPKSVNPSRLEENAALGWGLSPAEMALMDSLVWLSAVKERPEFAEDALGVDGSRVVETRAPRREEL